MEDLAKSLTELIDETLAELETLKKSRTEAEETTIDGADANGGMSKGEDEGEEDEGEEDEGEGEEDEGEEDEVKKAEERVKAAKKEMEKAEAECAAVKGKKKMEKSVAQTDDLQKSIDARVAPLETKISELTDLIKKFADSPVPSKGASFKDVQPLTKSQETEPLNKTQVLNHLVELKKSGKDVDANDVFLAEVGGGDLAAIANKYGIK